MIEWLLGGLFTIGAGMFCYLTCHINEERKQGKKIPFLWESKEGPGKFDKQGQVKYTKGDNT